MAVPCSSFSVFAIASLAVSAVFCTSSVCSIFFARGSIAREDRVFILQIVQRVLSGVFEVRSTDLYEINVMFFWFSRIAGKEIEKGVTQESLVSIRIIMQRIVSRDVIKSSARRARSAIRTNRKNRKITKSRTKRRKRLV